MMATKPTSDEMEIWVRMIGDDPKMPEMSEQAKVNVEISQLIEDF